MEESAGAGAGGGAKANVSRAELLAANNVTVLSSSMSAEQERAAVELSLEALSQESPAQQKEIARHLAQAFEKRYPNPPGQSGKTGVFHCIAGRNFACAITHETRLYVHLVVNTLHLVLFKSKELPPPPKELGEE